MPDLFGHSDRSPLIYPGGKTRGAKHILPHFPDHVDEIASPFLGGGSVEIGLSSMGVRVHGSDGFEPLVNFWNHVLADPAKLADAAEEFHPLPRPRFYELTKEFDDLGEFDRAVAYYVLNRNAFSGLTLSGGMGHGRNFNPALIQCMREFSAPNLSVELLDFTAALEKHQDKFLYLDPPYYEAKSLYGRKGDMHDSFPHERLAELLLQRRDWILSYDNCEFVRDAYAGHRMLEPRWQQGMGPHGDKPSNELLIFG